MFCTKVTGQEKLTSKEASRRYAVLEEKRVAFENIGENFEVFFINYLDMLNVVPYMTAEPLKRLNFYADFSHIFSLLGLHEEVIRLGHLFYEDFQKQPESVYENDAVFKMKKATFQLGELATAYAKLEKLDSAEWAHKETFKYKNKIDTLFRASIHNNYGLFFLDYKGNFNKALEQFELAKSIMSAYDKNDYFFGSIRDNIADVLLQKGDSLQARDLYYENFEFYEHVNRREINTPDYSRYYKAGYQFIEVSLALDRTEEIVDVLDRMTKLRPEVGNNFYDLDTHITYLKTKEMVMAHTGKIGSAYDASQEREQLVSDSQKFGKKLQVGYNSIINNNTIETLRANYELKKQQQATAFEKQRLTLWLVSVVSLLVIAILIFLYYERKRRLEKLRNNNTIVSQNLEITKLTNEKLNNEIAAKTRDLTDFALNISRQQEWITELDKSLKAIKEADTSSRDKKILEMEKQFKSNLSNSKDKVEFYHRIDKLSDSFYKVLLAKFPNLSKNDVRLCSLIRLKMDSANIASLQNITLQSLNKSRYRLRKKMALDPDTDLDIFIQNL